MAGAPDVILKGLFLLALFYSFYFARDVLLPVVLAVLLTLILSPAVRALRKLRLPEPVGAAVVVVALLAAFGFAVYSLIDPAMEWIGKVPDTMTQVEYKVRGIKKSVQDVTKAADKVEEVTRVDRKPPADAQVVAQKPSLVSRFLVGTQSVLIAAAFTVVLLYFLLASGDMFLRKLVRVLPTLTEKKRVVGVARAIQTDMARYLLTITCINVGLGVATGFAMFLLDMPNPVLWGVMVAVFNYVPYVGAGTSLTVLTAVAFLTFDEIGRVALVPAVFFALTLIESQILAPIFTGKSLTLNPVVIFLSMLFWGWLWGIIGALMAVPILMVFRICCEHIESIAPIGEFLSGKRAEPTAG
jgi:predicted PurR-regulated permease PerM